MEGDRGEKIVSHLVQVNAVVVSLKVGGHTRHKRAKVEDVIQEAIHHVEKSFCRVLVEGRHKHHLWSLQAEQLMWHKLIS